MKTLLVALNASFMHTSLSARQLRSAARRAGQGADLFEGHINLPYRKLLQQIAGEKAALYAFSCYIWNIELVMKLVRALRKARPEAKIALGGPEVSFRAESLLREEPSIDYVLMGEGELSFPALVRALNNHTPLCDIPGLAYRDGDIVLSPQNGPIDVSEWVDPYPDGIAGLEDRILYVETSRGCPYHCSYCLSSAEERVRAISAEEAVKNLTSLADQNAKLVKLVDRTFNFDRKRAREIWRGLIEHHARTGARTTYHFEIGAHLIYEETVALLKTAPEGLFQLEVGIQSTDGEVLRAIGRTAPFEKIREAATALHAAKNIHLHTDLIAGLPGEDLATFARSFDEAYALGAEMLQLGFLKLLHGSGLRQRADALGIVYEDNPPYEVIRTPALSFDELCFLKDVEVALSWYGNSGRYRGAMRLLLHGEKPFSLYGALARHLRSTDMLTIERGEKARAQALLDFAGQKKGQIELFSALLRHDLLSAGRRRDLPDALAYTETDAQRAQLRLRFHPVRGQTIYEYAYDVEQYRRNGEVIKSVTPILYNPPELIYGGDL